MLRLSSAPDRLAVAAQAPLYVAARNGYFEVVRCLLERGADPNASNERGYSALHSTCHRGDSKLVDLLLQHGANANVKNSRGDTPLHEAAGGGQNDVIRRLLSAGVDVNVTGKGKITPLHRSILSKHFATARYLLERGANPHIQSGSGNTALMFAMIASADDELVDELIRCGPDICTANNSGTTPLMQAVRSAPWHVLKLIENGADTLARGVDDITVFHLLAVLEDTTSDHISHLLKRREHLNVEDDEGMSPIHYAAQRQNPAMVRLLLEHGAKLNVRDRQGRTPMHHAVRVFLVDDFRDIFGDFLPPSSGEGVNFPDYDGWTPLHWACKGVQERIVKLLLSHNALDQVHKECIRGWTPWRIAMFHDQEQLLETMAEVIQSQMSAYPSVESHIEPTWPIAPGTVHRNVLCADYCYTICLLFS